MRRLWISAFCHAAFSFSEFSDGSFPKELAVWRGSSQRNVINASRVLAISLAASRPVAGWRTPSLYSHPARRARSSSPLMNRDERRAGSSSLGASRTGFRYFQHLRRHSLAGLLAALVSCLSPFGDHTILPASAAPPSAEAEETLRKVAPPSAEAQETLRKGFKAYSEGFDAKAEELLTQSIQEWQKTKQASDETAALYNTRGMIFANQGKLEMALSDFTESLRLVRLPDSKPDISEIQRAYIRRADVNEKLQRWKQAEEDLSAAIVRLDDPGLSILESTNPDLFAYRGRARSRLGDFAGAADDYNRAEKEFKEIGQRIRGFTAAADEAIALYGADEIPAGIEKLRFVFKNRGNPTTNNPDDIPLLQELSRKDAELHLAYAGHLYDAGKKEKADIQWESGCLRVEAYVQDSIARQEEEKKLREADLKKSLKEGRSSMQKASSVANNPANSDFNARLNGMDPQSPYVTQRVQSNYFWYKIGESDVERRDPGNPLAAPDPQLSCIKFRDSEWLENNRPEWPPNLRTAVKKYADNVPQKPFKMPPKGSPPSKGEVEF